MRCKLFDPRVRSIVDWREGTATQYSRAQVCAALRSSHSLRWIRSFAGGVISREVARRAVISLLILSKNLIAPQRPCPHVRIQSISSERSVSVRCGQRWWMNDEEMMIDGSSRNVRLETFSSENSLLPVRLSELIRFRASLWVYYVPPTQSPIYVACFELDVMPKNLGTQLVQS